MKTIKGSKSPKAEEKTFYELSDFIYNFDNPLLGKKTEEKHIWTLFKNTAGKWKQVTGNIKNGEKVSYTFGEKVVGIPYKIEVHTERKNLLNKLETVLSATLIVTPRKAKEPTIGRVILLNEGKADINKAKFNESLTAQARTANLIGKKITFYLWEEGTSETDKYKKPKKALVNKNGIAKVKFNLSEYASPQTWMTFFQPNSNATKKFYVSAVYDDKKAINKTPVTATNGQPQTPRTQQPTSPPQTNSQPPNSGLEKLSKTREIIAEGIGSFFNTIENTLGTAQVKQPSINQQNEETCPNCEKDITPDELKNIFPDAPPEKLKVVANTYNKYMKDLNMNTCWNKAHLFAQARVEAGLSLNMKAGENFNYYYEGLSIFGAFQTKEGKEKAKLWGRPNRLPKLPGVSKEDQIKIANYAYSPPAKKAKELENTESNDGWNFRGRGLIQVTGKGFYKYCNNYTKRDGNDVIANPDLIGEKIELAVLASMIFFNWKGITKIANSTKDVKGKICPLVGKDVKTGNKSNYNEKQTAFDDITSKVFQIDLCRFGKAVTPKNKTGEFSTYDSKYTADSSTSYIDVIVPTDRKKEGLLVFFDDKAILHQCYVLGLGTGGEDRYTNGGYGNVPNGLWNVKQELNTPNVGVSFGNNGVIRLSPKEGDALKASSRSGILLHCGHTMGDGKTGLSDNGPLMVTHGCLRVYNNDMPIIQKFLTEQINKGKKVYIYVEETSDLNTMFTNYGTKPDPKDTVIRKNKKYDPQ